jgi:toxin CptA
MEEVTCELQYSGVAEAFLAGAAGATLAIVVFVPFPDAVRILAFASVVAGAMHARRRLRRLRRLTLRQDGRLALHFDGAGEIEARLRPGSFVAPWLTVVRWRAGGQVLDRTSVVLPDMLAAEGFRRLRVLLRHA